MATRALASLLGIVLVAGAALGGCPNVQADPVISLMTTAPAPLVAVQPAAAGDPAPKKSKKGQRIVTLLMVEGFFAANSLVAAHEPRGYGIGAVAFLPVALVLDRTDHRGILTSLQPALMFAAVGAYNLTIDEDEHSTGELFWRNMAVWNVAFAAVWAGNRIASPVRGPGSAEHLSPWSTSVGVSGRGLETRLTLRF